MSWVVVGWLGLLGADGNGLLRVGAAGMRVVVEVEEALYRYEPANNGAGPMWCSGSTCVVRVGEVVYATGLETIPGAKPLNNCRWVLWRRDARGWKRWVVDETGRTREPAPLAVFPGGAEGGRVWVSGNPTLNPPEREGGGPARPELRSVVDGLGSGGGAGGLPEARVEVELPGWRGEPRFTEHSYRSFAADGGRRELLLFQNIDYGHAEWAFRDAGGRWSAQGQLKWPWGAEYAKPQPIRICYPNVALQDRAVHLCGVSDILEPNPAWKAFKKEKTGREWDYDFRRLFYTHTPDVTSEPFREWVEVASRERTCGWISPADLAVQADGSVWVMWTERALDERLREAFFPAERQFHRLNLARIRDGRVVGREVLSESTEDRPGSVVGAARFHRDSRGRLGVVRWMSAGGGGGVARNEFVPLDGEGRPGSVVPVALKTPLTSFFTATPRAGSRPGDVIDLLGVRQGEEASIGYVRLRIEGE